jgi:hypothetical protein
MLPLTAAICLSGARGSLLRAPAPVQAPVALYSGWPAAMPAVAVVASTTVVEAVEAVADVADVAAVVASTTVVDAVVVVALPTVAVSETSRARWSLSTKLVQILGRYQKCVRLMWA